MTVKKPSKSLPITFHPETPIFHVQYYSKEASLIYYRKFGVVRDLLKTDGS